MSKFEIATSYTVLHFDEYPILFIGKNNVADLIIGSFLYEDADNDLNFFSSIVHLDTLLFFIYGKVSYRDVLKNAVEIASVTKNFNGKILRTSVTEFENIDEELLPFPESFCPKLSEPNKLKIRDLIGNISVFNIDKRFKEFKELENILSNMRLKLNSMLENSGDEAIELKDIKKLQKEFERHFKALYHIEPLTSLGPVRFFGLTTNFEGKKILERYKLVVSEIDEAERTKRANPNKYPHRNRKIN